MVDGFYTPLGRPFVKEEQILPHKDRRNIVVEYKGGGYDGCFWEWNHFMYDAKGAFHVLLATGYKGITDKETAENMLNSTYDRARFKVTEWDISDWWTMLDFVDGMTASFAKIVDKAMRKQGIAKLWGTCRYCGGVKQVRYMSQENWTGDGHGIAYFAKDLYCSEHCFEKEYEDDHEN